MNYVDTIEQLNREIRVGRSKNAKAKLQSLPLKSVPRRHRVDLANLCWRCGLPDLGLKFLAPVILSEQAQTRKDASDQENLEYSVLLQKVGSVSEALKRLQSIDSQRYPKVNLYRAFCHFSQWRYSDSVTPLETYLGSSQITQREALIGKVNLLSALIGADRLDDARKFLMSVQADFDPEADPQLTGNLYELTGQLEIFTQNYELARKALDQAKTYLSNDTSFGSLFVDKWLSFLDAHKNKSVEPLLRFKEIAAASGHSELMRDLDMLQLKIQFAPSLFNRLIYGSPHIGYRKRALRFLNRVEPLDDSCILSGNSSSILDLYFGCRDQEILFKQGKDIHRVLYALSCDMYRPISLAGLHEKMEPGEFFNIFSTPNKIHQLIHRARKEVTKKNLGLKIKETLHSYSMDTTQESLRYHIKKQMPVDLQIQLEFAKVYFESRGFKSQELCQLLKISKSTGQRILSYGSDKKLIQSNRIGKMIVYRFEKNTSKNQTLAA